MEYVYDDGGRRNAGFKGDRAGDCVTRSIAIATGISYIEVYNALNLLAKNERIGKRKNKISNSRTGVYKQTINKFMESIGWKWTATMQIGLGCKVHLTADELPSGRIVCSLTKHCVAVIDGVIHDTYDPSREGTRCVYGYWSE